ncbi:hypothetical protein MNBD_GAMMA18-1482 [hydrothermal vent metagenome]|uniref:Uncharacterized protein n=1 Tax=hydrothermal vent metagenome TaxID=652676 RepID=A0A3B1A1P9_9ZZZZ
MKLHRVEEPVNSLASSFSIPEGGSLLSILLHNIGEAEG